MGNITAVIAGCGGAGKTTATINLGIALAARGQRVLLVDGAAGLPDLDASLSLERAVRHTVSDVIRGRCETAAALVRVPHAEHLWLLPAGPTGGECLHRAAIADIVSGLIDDYDQILIDAPPGNEAGWLAAVAAAATYVVVAQHTVQHRRGVESVLSRLREEQLLSEHPLILFNRVTPARSTATGVSTADLLYAWGLDDDDVIGSIPEDDAVLSAKHNGVPLLVSALPTAAGRAFVAAAGRLAAALAAREAERDSDQTEVDDDVSRPQA
ncbi:MAG: AAA family ATPase [Chloroflexota bacterium]